MSGQRLRPSADIPELRDVDRIASVEGRLESSLAYTPPPIPMRKLHDADVRSSLEARLATLRPDSPRKWGKMSPDQMLWHVNQFMAASLGEVELPHGKMPLPDAVMQFMLIYLPWPKSAPTNPAAEAKDHYDFEGERARCRGLISRVVAKPIDSPWPVNANFGKVTGLFVSRLQARHLDHHFKQFGA
jgi:hypothetical protein